RAHVEPSHQRNDLARRFSLSKMHQRLARFVETEATDEKRNCLGRFMIRDHHVLQIARMIERPIELTNGEQLVRRKRAMQLRESVARPSRVVMSSLPLRQAFGE